MKKIIFTESVSTGLNKTGQSNTFGKGAEIEMDPKEAKRHVSAGAARYSDPKEQSAHEKEAKELAAIEAKKPLALPTEPIIIPKGKDILENEAKRDEEVHNAAADLSGVHKAIKNKSGKG